MPQDVYNSPHLSPQTPSTVVTLRNDTAGGTHLNKVQSRHFLRGNRLEACTP